MSTSPMDLPFSPPRSADFLRSTNIPSPTLIQAMKARPFNIKHDDPVVFRDLRAKHLASLRHLMPLGGQPVPGVKEHDEFIKVRDGAKVRVRIYTPLSTIDIKDVPASSDRVNEKERPLILMFHEGGWMFGDLTDEEMNCRLFARDLGCVVGNVEYRLAPEHLFPTWINDCWDVTQHFAQHASSYGANPHRGFIVGGSSAGGNISAVLAQLSRLENLQPPITGQYLSVPVLLPVHLVPDAYQAEWLSPWENLHDPVLQGPGVDRLKRHLEALNVDLDSILYTPLAKSSYPPTEIKDAKVEENESREEGETGKGVEMTIGRKVAPAYFQIAGLDPLRDHGLIYERILRNEYRVNTKVDLYPGFGHMFWTNWPDLQESHDFVSDTVRGVKWLLDQVGQ